MNLNHSNFWLIFNSQEGENHPTLEETISMIEIVQIRLPSTGRWVNVPASKIAPAILEELAEAQMNRYQDNSWMDE